MGIALGAVGLVACGGGSGGGTGDGGGDGAGICRMDADCDDGLFCNGAERCAPDDPAADERGCVMAEAGPCSGDQRCDEGGDACLASCEVDPDADGDGERAVACGGTDCDDTDPNRYAGNTEVCDATDHDEDCDPTTFGFRDVDGDGEPDAHCCNEADDGTRYCGSDCDDARPSVGPTAAEACDGLDNDCDGETDEESLEPVTYYLDADGDGQGNPVETQVAYSCEPPDGFVATAGDCNDSEPHVHVGAPELCDGMDNDCSLPGGQAGGPDPSEDADGDGHAPGDGRCSDEPATEHCPPCDPMDPSGCDPHCLAEQLLPADDCDDEDPLIHPDATERCNALDDDCDGETDEGAGGGGEPDAWCGPAMACVSRPDAGGALQAWCEGRGRIAMGGSFGCAVVGARGRVRCWGADWFGVLGGGDADGDGVEANDDGPLATLVRRADGSVLEGAVQVVAGSLHACALMQDGTAQCWGSDLFGQLGAGARTTGPYSVGAASPVCESGSAAAGDCVSLSGIVQLAAGGDFTCAVVRADDAAAPGGVRTEARCWGRNAAGQLGDGTLADRRLPAPVEVAGGGGPLSEVVQVAAGSKHACARLRDGTARCWGANERGQLGDGSTTDRRAAVEVTLGDGTVLADVAFVGLGEGHSCAVLRDGSARCWGDNGVAQLGIGATVDSRPNPEPVVTEEGPALSGARAVALGRAHGCALLDDGTVRCWGDNQTGELGRPVGPTPSFSRAQAPVAGLSGVLDLSAKDFGTCALLDDDSLRCWGNDTVGQLGDGGDRFAGQPVLNVDGTPLRGATSVAGGFRGFCAVLDDGTVRCWGDNEKGGLGDGSTAARAGAAPVCVAGSVPGGDCTALSGVAAVTVGGFHACALLDDGTVRCWGDNDRGQLGSGVRGPGTATSVASPVCATGSTSDGDCMPLGGVTGIATGAEHTCAVVDVGADGDSGNDVARCWGDNLGRELGDGTSAQRSNPVPVCGSGSGGSCSPLGGLREIVATHALDGPPSASGFTCAVVDVGGDGDPSNDTAYCWGNGSGRGRGPGPVPEASPTLAAPVLLPDGTPLVGVRTVAVAHQAACAVVDVGADGDPGNDEVRCWGNNVANELGRAILRTVVGVP